MLIYNNMVDIKKLK